jgi:Tol biopolymer transport system component
MVGERIGDYRILSELTAGATGPLYIASLEHSDRQVILKFLPRGPLKDDALWQVLIREIATVARLTHPHIVGTRSVEEHDGQAILVIDKLDGIPLAEQMAAGPGTELRVLDLAAEILDGLEAVHEYGLLHCDIRPDNILLDAEGHAHLIGLGLGKNAEKLRSPEADRGEIPRYLAPEQLQKGPCSEQTDLFSLGAVLYEWLTGEHPFPGEDEDAYKKSLSAVKPPPPSRKARGLSGDTDALVLKALASDPSQRFQNAASMREAVERIRRNLRPGEGEMVEDDAAPASRLAGFQRRIPLLIAAAAVIVVAWSGWRLTRQPTPPVTQEPGVAVTQITDWPGVETEPCISPDGSRIVFASDASGGWDLWVANMETGRITRITQTPEHERHPGWSPDGEAIVYCLGGTSEGIRVIPAAGGPWVEISPSGCRPDWSPIGDAIAFDARTRTENSRIWVVTPMGEVVRQTTRTDRTEEVHVRPRWSPDGESIIYQRITDLVYDVWTVTLETGMQRHVSQAPQRDFDGVWDPTGKWIYFCSGIGDSVHIFRTTPGGGRRFRMTVEAGFYSELSISGDGRRIVFSTAEHHLPLWRVRVDNGKAERVPTSLARTALPSISPDGSRIALMSDDEDDWDVFVVEDGVATRVTTEPGDQTHPRWAPDGGCLAFLTPHYPEGSDIHLLCPGGVGEQGLVLGGENQAPRWSSDGRWLVFVRAQNPNRKDVWTVDVTTGQTFPVTAAGVNTAPQWSPDGSQILFHSRGETWSGLYAATAGGGMIPRFVAEGQDGSWSPDGTAIAYTAGEPGHEDIWVMDLEEIEATQLTDQREGFCCPVWSPDGRYIAFLSDRHGSPDVWFVSATGGMPRRVAENTTMNDSPVWSPDGKWLYYTTEEKVNGDVWMYEMH